MSYNPNLSHIDWTAPATDVADALMAIAHESGAFQDWDDAQGWVDEMIGEHLTSAEPEQPSGLDLEIIAAKRYLREERGWDIEDMPQTDEGAWITIARSFGWSYQPEPDEPTHQLLITLDNGSQIAVMGPSMNDGNTRVMRRSSPGACWGIAMPVCEPHRPGGVHFGEW